ncbi:YifB family Mg chelatase-like AAA ATPase [Bacillaceae bacterium IKA-2]|nr:YifB family Mg chelatase-like AAA ATPase [Bacillaceae bacterium IKA-2]
MSAKVNSIGLKGLDGYLVQVEVQVMEGVESVIIVGLPDASVKESRERVSAALHNMGYPLVDKKVVVNLSPTEQKKNGPLFDTAIALGALKSGKFVSERLPTDAAFIGALSLDGSILPVAGMLPAVLAAKRLGMKKLYLPFDPNLPAIEIDDLELIYVETVDEILQHLAGRPVLSVNRIEKVSESTEMNYERDFRQIIGHPFAKRALEIAAAGGHHLMMDGPPGCGKSLLAETFPSILPPLSKEAQLEKVSLYQLAGAPLESIYLPPFRSPHHSASAVSIIGGGSNPKPGEVSLAHRGVLFLDELAEFAKKTLDMLRQPLENGKVTINRAHSTVSYPSKFIFIAAMNPCPCGYKGSNSQYCSCSENQVKAYQNRISGPIRDRIDILLSLKPVNLRETNFNEIESSEMVRNRVSAARDKQYQRYGKTITNGEVVFDQLVKTSPISSRQQQILQEICMEHGLSNRVHIKVIRLARTISDLDEEKVISDLALLEALKLRKVNIKELG